MSSGLLIGYLDAALSGTSMAPATLTKRDSRIRDEIVADRATENIFMSQQQKSAEILTIDMREIPPRERHPLLFTTFDELEPGTSFRLVNDHDPKPLYYQFMAERPGLLGWEYLEEGPEVWQVRLAKNAT
jgi:uncharacterized protein (DUF2249 family)